MKIRKGFVSNSSSSSFVVAGFVLDDDDQTNILLVDTLENLTGEILDHEKLKYSEIYNQFFHLGFQLSNDYFVEGKIFLGLLLANNDGCDEDCKVSFSSMVSKISELTDALGVRQEPVIITGTRDC